MSAPQPIEHVTRRERTIERIEMDAGRATSDQVAALSRRVLDAERADGVGVVAARLARGEQRRRNGRAAERGEALDLREVRDRHDAGDDRHFDTRAARALDERKIVLVVEEELRDQKVSAGLDLGLEIAEIAV